MSQSTHPQLSAVYIPGQGDDLCIPEVISPKPQRIIPEIPSNIQQELSDSDPSIINSHNSVMSTDSSEVSSGLERYDSTNSPTGAISIRNGYEFTNESLYQNLDDLTRPQSTRSLKPSFFPRVQKAHANLPMSSQEKGEFLERVRPKVLKSTDSEVQLAWAQDALSWVEIEIEYNIRTMHEAHFNSPKGPRLENRLQEDAMKIVLHLGEQGHPKAEFIRANWSEFGKFGYPVDKKKAFLGYSRAAENGFARAEYRIGMQYEDSKNAVNALERYRKGVAMKDSASHCRLGMMSLLGQFNTPIDYARGINLLRFAAETADENSPQGSYVYGMLLARELPSITIPESFIPCDKMSTARMYIEKAAYLGFRKAQLKMGLAYELCQLGCDFDPTLSLHYNALASRQGEPEAEMAISKWFLCGCEGLFEKNEELAFIYARRAAAAGLPMAEFAMGYFHEMGIHVAIDLHESDIWYQKSAKNGNVDALVKVNSYKSNNVVTSQILPPRSSLSQPGVNAPYPIDDTEMMAHIPGSGYVSDLGLHSDRPHSAYNVRSTVNTNVDFKRQGNSQRSFDETRPSAFIESRPVLVGRPNSTGDRIISAGREAQQMDFQSFDGPQMDVYGHPYEPNRERLAPVKLQRPATAIANQTRPHNYPDDPNTRLPPNNFPIRPKRVSSATSPFSTQAAPQPPQRIPNHNMTSHQVIQPRTDSRPVVRPLPSAPMTSPPATTPKKTGPVTFEEMGIPAANKQGECVSLSRDSLCVSSANKLV